MRNGRRSDDIGAVAALRALGVDVLGRVESEAHADIGLAAQIEGYRAVVHALAAALPRVGPTQALRERVLRAAISQAGAGARALPQGRSRVRCPGTRSFVR